MDWEKKEFNSNIHLFYYMTCDIHTYIHTNTTGHVSQEEMCERREGERERKKTSNKKWIKELLVVRTKAQWFIPLFLYICKAIASGSGSSKKICQRENLFIVVWTEHSYKHIRRMMNVTSVFHQTMREQFIDLLRCNLPSAFRVNWSNFGESS